MSESEPLGANAPPTAPGDAPAPDPAIPDAGADLRQPNPEPSGEVRQPHLEPATEVEVEVVDALPVLAEVRTVERASPTALPAVQVAAVAATGFVAGAATVVLVKRLSGRKLARSTRGGPRRAADMLPIAASRSFLVDVHVIAKPD